MRGSYGNSKPWAEKLQDIALPEADDAWKAMAEVLDREMPQSPGRDKRRWLLLIILLLLLLGICNCPGRWRSSMSEAGSGGTHKERTESISEERTGGVSGEKTDDLRGERREAGKVRSEKMDEVPAAPEQQQWVEDSGERKGQEQRQKKGHQRHKAPGSVKDVPGDRSEAGDTSVTGGQVKDRVERDLARNPPDGPAAAKRDSSGQRLKTKINKNPGSDTAATSKAKDKKTDRRHHGWWAAGLGLNQFFTLGQQQKTDYNSGGTTGHLGDYLPVPMVRYYFNRKLFIQLEAQFNAPQYTKKNLLVQQTVSLDTTNPAVPVTQQNSVYIKKLFYFNLPLSIHFSPFKDLYVGTGVQFSRLSNGVGLFGDNINTAGVLDTVSKVKSLRSDPVYHALKTDEFRWLLDASYTYKHFIFGLRYNQALTHFINVQISTTGQVVQSRNSSLQLYLRYILWESRKQDASSAK